MTGVTLYFSLAVICKYAQIRWLSFDLIEILLGVNFQWKSRSISKYLEQQSFRVIQDIEMYVPQTDCLSCAIARRFIQWVVNELKFL